MRERLDRLLVTLEWLHYFLKAYIEHIYGSL